MTYDELPAYVQAKTVRGSRLSLRNLGDIIAVPYVAGQWIFGILDSHHGTDMVLWVGDLVIPVPKDCGPCRLVSRTRYSKEAACLIGQVFTSPEAVDSALERYRL